MRVCARAGNDATGKRLLHAPLGALRGGQALGVALVLPGTLLIVLRLGLLAAESTCHLFLSFLSGVGVEKVLARSSVCVEKKTPSRDRSSRAHAVPDT